MTNFLDNKRILWYLINTKQFVYYWVDFYFCRYFYGVTCKEFIVAAPFINPPDVKSDRFVLISWPSFVL